MTNWPTSYDGFGASYDTRLASDAVGPDVKALAHAVDAIQTELGLDPSGASATVAAALAAVIQGGVGVFIPNHDYAQGAIINEAGVIYYANAAFHSGSSFVLSDWNAWPSSLTNVLSATLLGAANGVCELGPDRLVPSNRLPAGAAVTQTMVWTKDGNATLGYGRWSPPMPTPGTLLSYQHAVDVAPDGTALISDLESDVSPGGVSVFTAPGNRPSIQVGQTKSNKVTPDNATFPAGTRFRERTVQIGSQPGASTPAIVNRSIESSTTALTKTVNVPAGIQTGHLMIVSMRTLATAPDQVPTGWTQLGNPTGPAAGTYWMRRWWKVYAGELTGWTWDFTSSGSQTFSDTRLSWYSGVDTSSPIDAVTSSYVTAQTTAMTPPGLTTATDGALEVYFWNTFNSVTSSTGVPTGMTGFGTSFTTADIAHIATAIRAVHGTQANPTVTPSASSAAHFTRVALKPQPAPTTWSPGVGQTAIMRWSEG